MNLDMREIQKLNPPGLWQLKSLAVLIDTMLKVVEAGIGGRHTVLANSRRLGKLAREFRRKKAENLNIRIKAWVLQCPERIAWVRGIIGERAIKRWQKNRLADYAFTKVFGDWKSKFPNGLKNKENKARRKAKSIVKRKTRTYTWKPFALQKIDNVESFLYGKSASQTVFVGGFGEILADFEMQWKDDLADTTDTRAWSQPRTQRSFKPVEFTPHELVPEAATGIPEQVIEQPKPARITSNEPEIFPPPKAELSPNNPTLEEDKTGFQQKPP